ncbi:IS607 family transposase [Dactylosporangium sp. CA-233914]|uniref:IS607 family transposase n=1 Tax=Dactylosporangium sp. CA-233914 TaxID=3239934 RepID=UPI003D8CC3AB
MNLTEWAKVQGVHPHTAYRWFREGTLPVPATRVGPRTILVNVEAAAASKVSGGVGLYARVSSRDQKADLERQVARLSSWAAQAGLAVARIEAEVGSGMNGARVKARRLLADPDVTAVVVEHRDRLGRMNTELVEAALSATGRRLVVLDGGEVQDDLVRDMVEVLTSCCARLYGRGSARNRAAKALAAAELG